MLIVRHALSTSDPGWALNFYLAICVRYVEMAATGTVPRMQG